MDQDCAIDATTKRRYLIGSKFKKAVNVTIFIDS